MGGPLPSRGPRRAALAEHLGHHLESEVASFLTVTRRELCELAVEATALLRGDRGLAVTHQGYRVDMTCEELGIVGPEAHVIGGNLQDLPRHDVAFSQGDPEGLPGDD